MLVWCFFGPEIAAYWSAKTFCFFVELGFSTLTAYKVGRKVDPSAYDEHEFWLKYNPQLKEDYIKACKLFEVGEEAKMETIKTMAAKKFN